MKTTELNINLIGKRVSGVTLGFNVTGTITHIVYLTNRGHEYYDTLPDYIETAPFPPYFKKDSDIARKALLTENVCSAGVEIQLDKPVYNGDEKWTKYQSTSRTFDEWGNLEYTNIIE